MLEQLAALELGLEDAGQLDHAAHVAVADRDALLEDDLQQPAGGDQLRLEVGDHFVCEYAVSLVVEDGRAHDVLPPVEVVDVLDADPWGVPI